MSTLIEAVGALPAYEVHFADCDSEWAVSLGDVIALIRQHEASQPAAGVETDVAFAISSAMEDIIMERKRQMMVEGWTEAHDNRHDDGQMAQAAACYLQADKEIVVNSLWPWDWKWWKPKDRRRDLVRAGALVLAEIERLDRITKG